MKDKVRSMKCEVKGRGTSYVPRSFVLRPSPFALRPAFSLVELMLAMIILGFGLLMIGAVLPIAWKSSLDLSALTKADGAADAAKYYIETNCRVDGKRDLFDPNQDPLMPPDGIPDSNNDRDPNVRDRFSYNFLGDFDTLDYYDPNLTGTPDTPIPLVHVLHIENWAIKQGDTTFRLSPAPTPNDFSVPEAPILIDRASTDPLFAALPRVGIPADLSVVVDVAYPYPGVGAPVVKLRDRVFPPIPASLTPEDYQWLEVLNGRKFAWGVLHQLLNVPTSANDARQFMMYYVTLRRGGSGNRYARQDHNSQPLDTATNGGKPPLALRSEEDVMFPIAWRVPVVIVESMNGVPAVAFAGAPNDGTLRDFSLRLDPPFAVPYAVDNEKARVADMLPRGAVMVDEVNGNVYRVTRRELLPDDDDNIDVVARLTLDREVQQSDLDPNFLATGTFTPSFRNRVVWVYPPAVAKVERNDDAPVSFVGPSPVVDIRIEPLTLMP